MISGLLSCGGDGGDPSGGDGVQRPGTAVAWSEVTGILICHPGSVSCPGDRGFAIASDGAYSVAGEERGSILPEELSVLIERMNAVAAQDLDAEASCSHPSELPQGGTAAEGVRLGLRRAVGGAEIVFYERGTAIGLCHRGTRERGAALEQALAPLISKYASDRQGAGEAPGEDLICTAEYAYGVIIEVRNGAGDAITDASAELRDGSFQENMVSLGGVEPAVYVGAGERPGAYALSVSAPGYRTYEETGIQVNADECHVISVRRQIVLEEAD